MTAIPDVSPLTVWVGSRRYDFAPGRDVTVGTGDHCDIRLQLPAATETAPPDPSSQPIAALVLRFAGTHWLAVDQSHHGLYLDGARLSTIDIRDGQTIAIGDALRGPWLSFQVTAPSDAPAPNTDPLGVRLPAPPAEAEPATGRIETEPETTGISVVPAPAPPVPPVPAPPAPPVPTPPADGEPAPWRIPSMPVKPPEPVRPAEPTKPPEPVTPTTVVPTEPETTRLTAVPATGALPEAPAPADMPAEPIRPTTVVPAEPQTTRIPVAPPQHSPLERPTRPFQYAQTGTATAPPPPATDDAQAKGRGLVERMTDATRKLLPARADTGPGELAPQTGRLPLLPGARTKGVAAYELGLSIDGHEVLANVSFTTRPGSLIAVIGPSAARNFALTALLAGTRPPSSGILAVDGHDVHAEPDAMRFRIGIVPRDNRVHRRLTVQRALEYAAELRLPPNTTPENRARVVQQILDELELTSHRSTRVAKLPPEARRCASMAVELLARPSLLVVDEPGAGLDLAQANQVMRLLRRQADLGCVVVVASTSPAYLNLCDQALLLTPAGRLAYAGPPSHVESALGTTDWSNIFAWLNADPHGAHHQFLVRQQSSVSPTPPSVSTPDRLQPAPTFGQQFRLLIRRQLRLLLGSPIYSLFLLLLPFALGALTLLVSGNSGLGRPGPSPTNAHEAIEILAALNFSAVLVGITATMRDLVGERRIFRREQAVGLSTSAYLVAKLAVFSVIAAVQAAILTAIVIVGKGGPQYGAVLLGNADIELYVSVAATAIVSAIVGLALSSFGRSLGEVLPLAIPAILASLLFAGGLVSLVGTWGYDQISWFIPAQWGFAAAAATVNLRRVEKLAAGDAMWTHYSGWWAFDMLMLVVLGAMWAGFVRYRLRRPATSREAGTA